jgi:hypothetical protein
MSTATVIIGTAGGCAFVALVFIAAAAWIVKRVK